MRKRELERLYDELNLEMNDYHDLLQQLVRWHDTDGGDDPVCSWQGLINDARIALRQRA